MKQNSTRQIILPTKRFEEYKNTIRKPLRNMLQYMKTSTLKHSLIQTEEQISFGERSTYVQHYGGH